MGSVHQAKPLPCGLAPTSTQDKCRSTFCLFWKRTTWLQELHYQEVQVKRDTHPISQSLPCSPRSYQARKPNRILPRGIAWQEARQMDRLTPTGVLDQFRCRAKTREEKKNAPQKIQVFINTHAPPAHHTHAGVNTHMQWGASTHTTPKGTPLTCWLSTRLGPMEKMWEYGSRGTF